MWWREQSRRACHSKIALFKIEGVFLSHHVAIDQGDAVTPFWNSLWNLVRVLLNDIRGYKYCPVRKEFDFREEKHQDFGPIYSE